MNRTRLLTRIAAAALALAASAGAQAQFSTNLIVNGGADLGVGGDGSSQYAGNLPGWTVTGQMMAIAYSKGCPQGYPCLTDPGAAAPGLNHFAGGNVATSTASQNLNLGFAGSSINGAGAFYQLSGYLGGYASQSDNMSLTVMFKSADNQVLGTRMIGPVTAADRNNATAMLLRDASGFVPVGTVSADVKLTSTRVGSGSSNDGYADQLSFSLLAANATINAPKVATVGSTFTAQVAVNTPFSGDYAGDELLAFGFDLGFDTTKLKLSGIQMAPGWDDDTATTGLSVAGSHFPGVGDAGQGSLSLATLTFTVLAEGDVDILLRSDLSNPNAGLTYALGNNANLLGHTQITLVPEPGSALLMLLGSGGLMLLRRRQLRA